MVICVLFNWCCAAYAKQCEDNRRAEITPEAANPPFAPTNRYGINANPNQQQQQFPVYGEQPPPPPPPVENQQWDLNQPIQNDTNQFVFK